MDSLVFSLNATVPVFLMIVLGMLFRRLGWLDRQTAAKLNGFVFRVPLPVLTFADIAGTDIAQVWNGRFVLFCFAVTAASVAIAWAMSLLWRDRSIRGEFIQASYRSSAALLGAAFLQNLYGSLGAVPLMMLGSVPLYNVMAVAVLSALRPEGTDAEKGRLAETLRGVVTNPIILGIAAGLLWSLLRLPMPAILDKTVSSLGATASPLGLMAMGASFDPKSAASQSRPALAAAAMKLAGFCALWLPAAIALGFRDQELVCILVMLGSATTVSAYVMARSMGHAGTLTASVVMLTTLLSGFTFTGWLWLLRSLGYI